MEDIDPVEDFSVCKESDGIDDTLGIYNEDLFPAVNEESEPKPFSEAGDDEGDVHEGDSSNLNTRRKRTPEEKAERKRRKKEKKERKRLEREQRKQENGARRQRLSSAQSGEVATSEQSTGVRDDGTVVQGDHSQQEDRRQKKRRKADFTEAEAADVARQMIQRMRDAAEEDDRARSEGRPAVAKLKLLNEACAEIGKPKWMHWYLREGVCDILARWLMILPGGTLPNMTIRTRMLQLMHKIPISIEHLHGTELGVRLVQLWHSSEELEENRALIRSLVQLLLRPVFGLHIPRPVADSMDDSRVTSLNAARSQAPHEMEQPSLGSRRSIERTSFAPTQYRSGSRLPIQRGHQTFKVMPRPSFKGLPSHETSAHRENESTVARLNRMINCKKTFSSGHHVKRSSASTSGSCKGFL